MSKDLTVTVTIKYEDIIGKDTLDAFSMFHERSTEAIKRKLVDEVVAQFTSSLKPEDLDIDLSDVKQLVKQRIIDKAADAAVDALGIRND